MSKNNKIVQIILEEREKEGISKEELAAEIGCSVRLINYWERGERGISIDMADKALKFLGKSCAIGVTSKELLEFTQEPKVG